ncbi:hypothetical protein V2A60_006151 [Cordyceps javanica]|uniref:Gfd2/YDR514C-like C-terminal domain-containing protein n=1 Tax=Cordyceps javanica TaxID=43265 RepID=A0A545W3W6_9HYPO|nr:hypothetical protein IF1G_03919 [Cordyceps javanica]TQW08654.1 hypothetical protein IF2G_03085 [Cordyceps javanica]
MKHVDKPRGFKIRHWRQLFDACISNRDALTAAVAENATFVVLDAEPWAQDNTKAAEIGMSILQMPDTPITLCDDTPSPLPETLSEFSESCRVESHRILFSDRTRSARRKAHRFGIEHEIPSLDAAKFITSLVDTYRQKHKLDSVASSQQIVFVGFDVRYEFQLLSTIYTTLTNYFTSWLDVQELARLSSNVYKPGLSETLKACGFGRQALTDLHSLNGRHNSTTDTVRAAAILHHLFARDGNHLLRIATSDRNAKRLAKKRVGLCGANSTDPRVWIGARPKPKELYPYTARVKRSTGDILVSRALVKIFAEHEPVAIGIAKQNTNRYGWVCLPSLSALHHFLESVNGSVHPEGGTWIAVSDYDPQIIPAKDGRELKDRLHAKADEKREQRRLKRLASETTLFF